MAIHRLWYVFLGYQMLKKGSGNVFDEFFLIKGFLVYIFFVAKPNFGQIISF